MAQSEFELIKSLQAILGLDERKGLQGFSDDAAVLTLPDTDSKLLFAVDTVIEGVHFFSDTPPESVGWKALASNVSDIAAMGGCPTAAVVSLQLKPEAQRFAVAVYHGLKQASEEFGVAIVGGDTVKSTTTGLAISILGTASNGVLLRSAAKPSEDIWVSGTIGAAALGFLQRMGDLKGDRFISRWERPQPRYKLGMRLSEIASAAIDVSDGLLQDLGHIAEASNVGIKIELERIPFALQSDDSSVLARQLTGGEDFELVFTAPPSMRDTLAALNVDAPLERIGCCCELLSTEDFVQLAPPTGKAVAASAWLQEIGASSLGYRHF